MGSDEERTGGRSKEKEETLASSCSVCGSPAAAHLHYGAVSCYSCRAFFRRGQPKQVRWVNCHPTPSLTFGVLQVYLWSWTVQDQSTQQDKLQALQVQEVLGGGYEAGEGGLLPQQEKRKRTGEECRR